MNLILKLGLSLIFTVSCSKTEFELKTDTGTSTETSASTASSSSTATSTATTSTDSSLSVILTQLDPVVVSGGVVNLELQNLGTIKPADLSISLTLGGSPAGIKVNGSTVQVTLPMVDAGYTQVKTSIRMATQALYLATSDTDTYSVFVVPTANIQLVSSVPWHVCAGVHYYDPVSKSNKVGTESLGTCIATKKCTASQFPAWVSTDWVCTPYSDLADATKSNLLKSYLLEEEIIPETYSQTTVVASVNSLLADGSATTNLTVTLLAHDGAPVQGKTVDFNLSFGSLSAISNSGVSDTNGVVSASLSSIQAGVDHVAVSVEGQSVGSIDITFTAGSPVSAVISIANSSIPGDGTLTPVSVTLKDANNNVVPGINVSSNADFGNIDPAFIASDTNGVSTFNLSSTSLGLANLTFSITGITPSPTTQVTYVEGAADPASSTVHVLASTGPADGTSTIGVEVTLKDAASHLLSGIPVTLSSSLGAATILTSTLNTDVNGLASFSVKSSGSGLNTVTAMISGPVTIGTDQMTFTDYFANDVILSAGPVAFWQFNESSGSVAADSSSSHLYPATYVNSPSFDSDGVNLNGTDQYITVPSTLFTDNFASGQDFTIEGWYKSSANPISQTRLFDFENLTDNKYLFLGIRAPIDNQMYYDFNDGISQSAEGGSSNLFEVNFGEHWTYVALVIDGVANTATIYQDDFNGGYVAASSTLTGTMSTLGALSTNSIGTGTNSLYISGHLRNFAIFNRALNSTEIGQHKDAPLN